MTKKIFYSLLILNIIAAALVVKKNWTQEISIDFAGDEVTQPMPAPVAEQTTAPAEAPSAVATKSFSEQLKEVKVADTETARQEVAKNPHTTPNSVIATAIELHEVYLKISNESDAQLFLEKMQDCSKQDADTPTSVKAHCLGYATEIGKKYPNLKSQAETIWASSTPEAQRIEKFTRKNL